MQGRVVGSLTRCAREAELQVLGSRARPLASRLPTGPPVGRPDRERLWLQCFSWSEGVAIDMRMFFGTASAVRAAPGRAERSLPRAA